MSSLRPNNAPLPELFGRPEDVAGYLGEGLSSGVFPEVLWVVEGLNAAKHEPTDSFVQTASLLRDLSPHYNQDMSTKLNTLAARNMSVAIVPVKSGAHAVFGSPSEIWLNQRGFALCEVPVSAVNDSSLIYLNKDPELAAQRQRYLNHLLQQAPVKLD